MPPACPHHPVRSCLASEPSLEKKLSGLDPCPISPGYPTGTAPCPTSCAHPSSGDLCSTMAHSSWILHADMTHDCSGDSPGQTWLLEHARTVHMADLTSLHVPVQQQILDHHRAELVPAAWNSSFLCLLPAERKNLLIRRKYKALCCMGPAAGFLESRKW